MLLSLVVLGLVVKLFSTAVTVGLKRQSAKHPDPGPHPGQAAPAAG